MIIKQQERKQACQLRKQGLSINVIANQLGVAKSSVSNWVKDITLTDEQKLRLKQHKYNNSTFFSNRRTEYQTSGKIKAQECDYFHAMGCMLYWAEGTKRRNSVELTNADPSLLRLFIQFLNKYFNVQSSDILGYCFIHEDDLDKSESFRSFWIEQLDIEPDNMKECTVKPRGKTITRRTEHGVCKIQVCNTSIVQHIYGAIQEYGNFENKNWLWGHNLTG